MISTDSTTNNANESELVLKVQSLEQQLSQMKTELDKTKESNRQLLELVQNQNKDTRLIEILSVIYFFLIRFFKVHVIVH